MILHHAGMHGCMMLCHAGSGPVAFPGLRLCYLAARLRGSNGVDFDYSNDAKTCAKRQPDES